MQVAIRIILDTDGGSMEFNEQYVGDEPKRIVAFLKKQVEKASELIEQRIEQIDK
jgi:hypothetical protein